MHAVSLSVSNVLRRLVHSGRLSTRFLVSKGGKQERERERVGERSENGKGGKREREKDADGIIFELKKMKMTLMSYFPAQKADFPLPHNWMEIEGEVTAI